MKKAAVPIVIALVAVCGFGAFALKGAATAAARAKAGSDAGATATVGRGEIKVTVVETGKVDAAQVVELKSRVTGRVARLLVDEGDFVKKGQLIAVIDPQETRLRVEQDAAQLRGAESAVDRAALEIGQRTVTAKAAFLQAESRLRELEMEVAAQPILTQVAIRQAETALASARQERERLVQSVHPTQLTNAQSAVREADANFANAELEYRRQAELSQKGFVAGRTADTAKLTLDLARVRQETAKDNLAKLEAQFRAEVAKQDEQIRQAEAELTRAQANRIQNGLKRQALLSQKSEVEKARAAMRDPAILAKQREQSMASVAQLRSVLSDSQRQLGETEIRSPIDGVVTKKGLNVGEMATGLSTFSSGSTIVKLEDRSAMRVKLDMNEIDVAKMSKGMAARVDVDALPGEKFSGRVVKIAPASKDASQMGTQTSTSSDAVVRYEVEIVLDATRPSLRSGMTAKCSLDVVRLPNVLTVPAAYIGRENDATFVMLAPASKEGKPTKKAVVLGVASGATVEVKSGVEEGAKLVKPEFKGPPRKGAMEFGDGG
ncbi:MAG: HlyD family secretion protein [Fimbriimonas sp.]